MYVINDAHLHGVTSLALTSDSGRVVSGGSEGEVRVFRLGILLLLKGNRVKLWKPAWKNTEEESRQFKSQKIMTK